MKRGAPFHEILRSLFCYYYTYELDEFQALFPWIKLVCNKYLHTLCGSVCRYCFYSSLLPSVDKDTHGFDGQKTVHTSSKALEIHKVFPAAFSSSDRFSASAKLLAPDSDGFSCDFCFFETQMCRNPQKSNQSPTKWV